MVSRRSRPFCSPVEILSWSEVQGAPDNRAPEVDALQAGGAGGDAVLASHRAASRTPRPHRISIRRSDRGQPLHSSAASARAVERVT